MITGNVLRNVPTPDISLRSGENIADDNQSSTQHQQLTSTKVPGAAKASLIISLFRII